jgi:pyruvyltransferase
VTGSSLHAVVIAESLGIPARLIRSSTEPVFKYEDYYRGSGRQGFTSAANLGEARERGGEHPVSWSAEPLLRAFPADLWAA